MCATKTDVGKLANPAWSKANHQARTELCTQGGNKLRGAKGMANYLSDPPGFFDTIGLLVRRSLKYDQQTHK
jgi:hypothetical protein